MRSVRCALWVCVGSAACVSAAYGPVVQEGQVFELDGSGETVRVPIEVSGSVPDLGHEVSLDARLAIAGEVYPRFGADGRVRLRLEAEDTLDEVALDATVDTALPFDLAGDDALADCTPGNTCAAELTLVAEPEGPGVWMEIAFGLRAWLRGMGDSAQPLSDAELQVNIGDPG